MESDIVFFQDNKGYPIARIDDITIHFLRYSSEADAYEKLETRKRRVNYDNLFVIMSDKGGGSDSMSNFVNAFDELDVANKVLFSSVSYPEISSVHYDKRIGRHNGKDEIAYWHYVSPLLSKKYYDSFDFVAWRNNGLAKQ